MDSEERVEKMAEEHAEFIKQWYKAVFYHGYKHGRKSLEKELEKAHHTLCVVLSGAKETDIDECESGSLGCTNCPWY